MYCNDDQYSSSNILEQHNNNNFKESQSWDNITQNENPNSCFMSIENQYYYESPCLDFINTRFSEEEIFHEKLRENQENASFYNPMLCVNDRLNHRNQRLSCSDEDSLHFDMSMRVKRPGRPRNYNTPVKRKPGTHSFH